MAYTCSGSTNAELIENMHANDLIKSKVVKDAFEKVDRKNYVLDKRSAYVDSPQSIKYGATISAPHMHAYAAEYLLPFLKPGSKVLDVGSGSGYTCAVFHHLVSPKGKVVGIDHIPELVAYSLDNLRNDGLTEAINAKVIEVHAGDGREGWPSEGPYDAIHVGAAAFPIPKPLINQLASPGRMFVPVGDSEQKIVVIDKDEDGKVVEKELFGVQYVPLTNKDDQLKYAY
ncbi:protein-L-isoaspartate O-methyltransferase [Schizopora paradoxa]|uniref:Protein-L-isoaspartate O-methyltransferase n=1 Tax=Schizopora paradoxa TaxID=27342 RepID=A0A0H2R1M2_9AGAM|nr:protein-L-isoaspartate O-methyltransferase [Schizopora paradoxa]